MRELWTLPKFRQLVLPGKWETAYRPGVSHSRVNGLFPLWHRKIAPHKSVQVTSIQVALQRFRVCVFSRDKLQQDSSNVSRTNVGSWEGAEILLLL